MEDVVVTLWSGRHLIYRLKKRCWRGKEIFTDIIYMVSIRIRGAHVPVQADIVHLLNEEAEYFQDSLLPYERFENENIMVSLFFLPVHWMITWVIMRIIQMFRSWAIAASDYAIY